MANNEVQDLTKQMEETSISAPQEQRVRRRINRRRAPRVPLEERELSNDTIVLLGLTHDINQEDIKEAMSKHGEIESARIPRTRVGFVTFKNPESLKEALKSPEIELKGVNLSVQQAYVAIPFEPREPSRKREEASDDEETERPVSDDTVIVQGLNRDITRESLTKLFETYGTIKLLRFPLSVYAFITFTEPESAQKALAASGTSLDGVSLTVAMAYKRRARSTLRRQRNPSNTDASKKETTPEEPREKRKPRRRQSRGFYIFVAGLPEGTPSEQIKELFSQYNPKAVIPRTKYCFVSFTTPEDRTAALELADKEVDGAKLRVEESRMGPIRRRRPRSSNSDAAPKSD
eukprot:GCRY01000589.1.p1 GENE.GCRY01000589.1~~GCRY01000589.1.p1  ORF type:complete len:348 (+),score=62.57 GCRY01000589.1:160-1203(+)